MQNPKHLNVPLFEEMVDRVWEATKQCAMNFGIHKRIHLRIRFDALDAGKKCVDELATQA